MPSAIQPPAVRVDGPRIDGLRVLVVDDSEINREVAGLILEGVGARVTVAENGAQALELLKAEPQGFDVVLLDIQMPVLDGYETTRALRQIPEFESLPIFALTAGALSEQREVALAAGMNGFISKPFSAEALIACLAELPRARSPAGSATPRSVPLAAAPAPSSRAAPPPVFDDKAHASLWKNPDRYRSTLCSFLDEHRDDGARIRVALAAAPADWVKARQLAHKLAGAAGNMAFPQVAAAAREIEAALLGQRDAGAQVSELEAALHAAAALAEERFGAAAEGRSPPGRAVGDAKDKAPVHTAPEAGFDRAILVGALHYALDRADRAALLALLNQASLPPADAAALRACVERGDFAGASAQLEQYAQQGADEEMVGRAGLEPATKGL